MDLIAMLQYKKFLREDKTNIKKENILFTHSGFNETFHINEYPKASPLGKQ